MSFKHIPTIDLLEFTQGTPEQRAAFVEGLGSSFSEIGFAIIRNHGVPQELIDQSYHAFQNFFALSDPIKQQYEIEGQGGQRGYTGRGKEHAKGRNVADLKEFFHVGQTVEGDDPIAELYPENVEVEEVPGVNEYGVALYKALETSGKELLKATALYLNLEEDYFDAKIFNGNSILRAIHYYGIENPDSVPDDAVRAAEHEDINLITLLVGASAEGLEVKNTEGEWIPAIPEPDQIVVNVGDMLQRLTNNKLASTTHRVVNPPKERLHEPRYSMPFFLHPRSDMDLTSLESCVDAEHPKVYEDMTAGEYLTQRLREIGLIK